MYNYLPTIGLHMHNYLSTFLIFLLLVYQCKIKSSRTKPTSNRTKPNKIKKPKFWLDFDFSKKSNRMKTNPLLNVVDGWGESGVLDSVGQSNSVEWTEWDDTGGVGLLMGR